LLHLESPTSRSSSSLSSINFLFLTILFSVCHFPKVQSSKTLFDGQIEVATRTVHEFQVSLFL